MDHLWFYRSNRVGMAMKAISYYVLGSLRLPWLPLMMSNVQAKISFPTLNVSLSPDHSILSQLFSLYAISWSSPFFRFSKTRRRRTYQYWFHDRPLSRGTQGLDEWALPTDCWDIRKCREMSPSRIQGGWSILFNSKETGDQSAKRDIHWGAQNSSFRRVAQVILGVEVHSFKASEWRGETMSWSVWVSSSTGFERFQSSSHCHKLRKMVEETSIQYIV